MRLLCVGHTHERRRAARAKTLAHRTRRALGTGSQSLPLRVAQSHGPRRAARERSQMSAPAATRGTRDGSAPLPGSLAANRRLSQWLRFRSDRTLEVHPGKVELGQGILTALAQI